jgi:hypothetical protein
MVLVYNRAAAGPNEDCESIFEKAPRNTTDITDTSKELLAYGHSICSAAWKTLSDVQNYNGGISLNLLNIIGLTGNGSDSSRRFES